MFWDSFLAGLKVLTYWDTYIAGFMFLAIVIVPITVAGLVMKMNDLVAGALGCLSMFLMPFLGMIALAVTIIAISPIIFGFDESAAWIFPWIILTTAPSLFFKLIGVLLLATIILAFIPILGQFESLQTLVLGGIALKFSLEIIDVLNPGLVKGSIDFIPDFWFSVGLVLIGGVMSWVGKMTAAFLVAPIEMAVEGLGQLIVLPISAIFGFIPAFIYGAWLGAQVHGGF